MPENLLSALERCLSALEQALLGAQGGTKDLRIEVIELCRRRDRISLREFSQQSRLDTDEMNEALLKLFKFGPCPHVFEHQQDLSGIYVVTLAHTNLANNATFEVFDRLAAAVRAYQTGGNGSTRERCDGRPGSKPAEE